MSRNPSYFEYAAPLNTRTYPKIIAYAEAYGFHVAQEFGEVMQFETIPLHVNMIFDITRGVPESFGVFPSATFEACWHYGDGERGPFTRIYKNTYA